MESRMQTRQRLTHTFSVDHVSEEDGKRYKGTFTTKKLSIRELAQMGVRKVQLSGGLHFDANNPGHGLDKFTENLNDMLAQLEVSIVDSPPWWNLDDVSDLTLVMKVYQEVLSFENNFLGQHRQQAVEVVSNGGSSQGDSTSEKEGSNPTGSASQVVAEEVQSALEP